MRALRTAKLIARLGGRVSGEQPVAKQVRALTGGTGADAVYDQAGQTNQAASAASLARGGRLAGEPGGGRLRLLEARATAGCTILEAG